MGKIINFGKKFDKQRGRINSREFLRNIATKGMFGDRDPDKCHHPVTIIIPLHDKDHALEGYFAEECRDCFPPRIFRIFKSD